MVSADRQAIIETNKSLRLIKNELESLLEKGVIDDATYDSIHSLLPAEGSLHGAAARAAASSNSSTPAATRAAAAAAAPPSDELANLNLNNNGSGQPQPPAYSQSRDPPPPPPANSGKPVLSHARALYRYAGTDARDCAFERDDRIAVHEYMNADWWMGRNLRTGREGIFPRNYVEPEAAPAPAAGPHGYPADEKSGGYNAYGGGAPPSQQYQPPQPYGGYPPPQHQNPYNSHAPPMAIANAQPEPPQQQQQQAEGSGGGGSKMGEFGKKVGGKFGNAAIFGAGATLGGNLVNSIF